MKIVDIKTKIIPSNPRSKNYPIGYSGGIASNSNGVTPDLSIYLLKEIWERNIEERTDESGNEYLYIRKPLAIGGGATMYASDGTSVPSIFDGLPLDNQTIWKNPTTGKIEVIGGAGSSFDENAMWSALSGSSDNQINKSHLTTALDGYATQNWVIENYATKSELSAVSNKLNDFLEGSDADTIINKWKELEAFLSGMAETDNLAEILETKADKKYVDSTFVTLATKQTITGEKTFSSVLNTAAIKASGEITTPSLAASDYVTIAGIKLRKLEDGALMLEGNLALTGALTMYASNGQSFDTIYDGLPIDNDTIYWQEVDGSRVLKAREGSESSFDKSAMWTALAGSTTEQINKSHLTTALTGYATESWVSGKNYAVKATTLAGYGITDGVNVVSVTGTGNAVTAASISGHILTLSKGSTFSLEGHKHSWNDITSGKPTTLSGYGITDAYTKSESDSKYPTKTGGGASGTWGIAITGNAGSATKLQTARTLWGQSFDGTKNITGALTSVTDITGTGTFSGANIKATDSVYVNGIRLHKTADGVITLEGNLAVTGGVTTYAIDPVSASTVMDGVVVDGTTIKKENGKLVAVGGGEAGSVAWGNISGKPSVFATNIANITDLHSSWDAVLAAQKPAWLTAVSIATISDLHANWDALLKAAPSAYVTRWPTISEVTNKQNLVIKLNGGTTEGTNQFTYNATAAKSLNITPAGIGAYTKSESDSKYPTKTGSGASGTWGIAITGNAGSATKLQTARTLWGRSFDGTGNVSGNLDNVGNIIPSSDNNFILGSDEKHFEGVYTRVLRNNVGRTMYISQNANANLELQANATTMVTIKPNGDILLPFFAISKTSYLGEDYAVQIRTDSYNPYIAFYRDKQDWYVQAFQGFLQLGVSADKSVKVDNVGNLSSPGNMTATSFVGSLNGNATSATKLQTSRSLWGQSFNGEKDISGSLSNVGNIVPSSDNTYTLGDSTRHFDGAYVRVLRNNVSRDMYIAQNTANNLIFQTSGVNRVIITHNGNFQVGSSFVLSNETQDTSYSVRVKTESYNPYLSLNQDGNIWYIQGYNGYLYLGSTSANSIRIDSSGNILAPGGGTYYGSDIRYKSIMQQVNLSLLDIAKAPSFVYRWNKKGMKRDRLNLGGSAQYTQSILPWAVEENDNFLSMDYATVAYTFAVHTARHLLTYETRTDKKIKKLEREIVILKKQLKKLGYEEVRTLDDQSV